MVKTLLLIVLSAFCVIFCGCATNPVTGENQLMFISQDQDIEIGKQYAPEVEKQLGDRIDDPTLQNYINSVGQKVAKKSHMPNLNFHFTAVNDDSVNAMALPGGYIFITKGMLEQLDTEAQLAAILAHEVTHVTARHSAQAMSRQIGMDILMTAVTTEETPQALVMVGQLAGQLTQLKYSREDEYEADSYGMDYMVKAGYEPDGMVETMQILEDMQKTRTIEFLSTHPVPENRKAYLQDQKRGMYSYGKLRKGREDYKKYVLDRLESK